MWSFNKLFEWRNRASGPAKMGVGSSKVLIIGNSQNTKHGLNGVQFVKPVAILILLILSVEQLRADQDQVEPFKKYLSSPPCISRIVYSEVSCQGTEKRSLAGGWCGASFYVRQLTGKENPDLPISETNPNWSVLYVGCLGDTRWQIAGYNLTLSTLPDLKNRDPYAGMSDAMQIMLGGVINLGSQHVEPGTFVWEGTNFTVKASPLGQEYGFNEFKGGVVVSNQEVVRMVIQGSGMWDYKYSTNLPPGIPSEIVSRGGDIGCISKILIKKLTFTKPSSEMNVFDPRNLIDKSVTILKVLSNGVVVVKPVSNPKVAAIAMQEMEASVRSANTKKRSVVQECTIAALIVISAGFIAFVMWYKRRT